MKVKANRLFLLPFVLTIVMFIFSINLTFGWATLKMKVQVTSDIQSSCLALHSTEVNDADDSVSEPMRVQKISSSYIQQIRAVYISSLPLFQNHVAPVLLPPPEAKLVV